jgi:uncharacterized membrane protein YsdA (DUF1294 family)
MDGKDCRTAVEKGAESEIGGARLPGNVAEVWQYAAMWVAAWSLLAFAVAAFDKARARRAKGRISERALLLLALVGGSPGLVLAMLTVRHKTRKVAFLAPLALVIAFQAAVLWFALR